MAINKITAPGSTPDTFWPAVLAFFEAYALGIENAFRVKSTAHIAKGSFFAIGGSIYVADSDTAITGTPSAYVKLTPSGTIASPSYVANLTGVTWNDTYNGYYDGSGNLYIFDEVVARNSGVITELKTIRNWKTLNSAVLSNNAASATTVGGLDPVNGNAGTLYETSLSGTNTWVIPKGTYMMYTASWIKLQIYYPDNFFPGYAGGWIGDNPVSGMIISDGVNFRLRSSGGSANGRISYRKLA